MLKAFCVVIVMCAGALVAAGQVGSDEAAVREAVDGYLAKDAAAIRNSVSPDARIISMVGTKVRMTPLSAPAKPLPRGATVVVPKQTIVSVDVTDGGAIVKIASLYPGASATHYQYISLLKADGRWKIVAVLMPPPNAINIAAR